MGDLYNEKEQIIFKIIKKYNHYTFQADNIL